MEFILGESQGSTTLRVSGSQFIEKMALTMPNILKRSVTDRWMLGEYNITGTKFPFIIFTTDFFQNAFAGMLQWEDSMPDDLDILLGFREKARVNDSVGTSSIASYFSIKGKFRDRIVRNRDVREFVSDRGELLFLYSFIDANTFVLATSEATLEALIGRIEKQSYTR